MLNRFDLCIYVNHREPDYQIMVFCTSVEGAANPPALMEFPHVCEIKISGRVLEAVSSRSGKNSGSIFGYDHFSAWRLMILMKR